MSWYAPACQNGRRASHQPRAELSQKKAVADRRRDERPVALVEFDGIQMTPLNSRRDSMGDHHGLGIAGRAGCIYVRTEIVGDNAAAGIEIRASSDRATFLINAENAGLSRWKKGGATGIGDDHFCSGVFDDESEPIARELLVKRHTDGAGF